MFVSKLVSSLALSYFCVAGIACASDSDSQAPMPDASATSVPDAGDTNEADAMPSGGSIAYLETCEPSNDQCDTAEGLTCFSFNNKGPKCTHSCTMDSECESPSTGCNGMGVCKAP